MSVQFSKSAYETLQTCEQKYFNRYVRKLRPPVTDFAPQLGSLIHTYLEGYYKFIQGHQPFEDEVAIVEVAGAAHDAGLVLMAGAWDKVKLAIDTAWLAGREDMARDFASLYPLAVGLVWNYFNLRGQHDIDKYEVLLVEHPIYAKITDQTKSMSVIDLVLRDLDTGLVWLVEHKTTQNVPDTMFRLKDFQTLFYATLLERRGMKIDAVLWNYVRTKLPATPHLNQPKGKNPAAMSRDKGIDTTWSVYEAALKENNLDPDDYQDIRSRLYNAEYNSFFPRFEHIITAKREVLLRDYLIMARRSEQLQKSWARGSVAPIKHIAQHCQWCPYKKVCEAEIMGGDPEDVIRMRFLERTVDLQETADDPTETSD